VAAIWPPPGSFTRAAPRERLDGYVVSGPALDSEQTADGWARAALSELAAEDPLRRRQAAVPAGDAATEAAPAGAVFTLTFNGVPLSARVLPAPCPHILLELSDVEPEHRAR
jgi:hypothetical protein